MHSYPKHFLPWLWSILTLLLLSGLLLAPGIFELRLEWDVPFSLGSSRIAVAALHALAAFLMLVAVGALIPVHMRLGLRQKRNHYSGIAVIVWFGCLALSALGIYYLAAPTWSVIVSLSHFILGIALAIPFLWHWRKGRQIRLRRSQALAAYLRTPSAN